MLAVVTFVDLVPLLEPLAACIVDLLWPTCLAQQRGDLRGELSASSRISTADALRAP
jgi:hypothetical protein